MTTLTIIRDRVELTLQDSGNAIWTTNQLDEAIMRAIEEYSTIDPYETNTSLTLAAAGREVDISSVTGRIRITRAWWPYTSTDPEYPPNWCTFEEWNDVLFLDTGSEPASGDKVRVWYTTIHTLNGLAAATATTLPTTAHQAIIIGAAGFAAQQRAMELAETLNVDRDVVKKLAAWGAEHLGHFSALLDRRRAQLAAQAAGIAQAPRLDRWDQRDDEQW